MHGQREYGMIMVDHNIQPCKQARKSKRPKAIVFLKKVRHVKPHLDPFKFRNTLGTNRDKSPSFVDGQLIYPQAST